MIALFYKDSRITDFISGPASSVLADIEASSSDHIIVEEIPMPLEDHYIRNGEVHEKPPRLGENYIWSYAAAQWILDVNANTAVLNSLRSVRRRLLQACDWTQLPDVIATMEPETAAAWAEYRQALRDLPETYSEAQTLTEVDLPEPPA